MAHTVGVLNGNWRAGMYVELRRELEAEARNAAANPNAERRQESQDKEVVRKIKGDDFLQAWIKENMGLPTRVYRQALTELAKKVISE